MSTNTYFGHYVIPYIAKYQSIEYAMYGKDVLFLCSWEFDKRNKKQIYQRKNCKITRNKKK